jgi:hypothetical protein
VKEVTDNLFVHVVPFGEVSITQLQAAVFVLLRYQKENTAGDAI